MSTNGVLILCFYVRASLYCYVLPISLDFYSCATPLSPIV